MALLLSLPSSIECTLDLNAPSNRPPLRTNMKLIEHAHSNRGNTVCPVNCQILVQLSINRLDLTKCPDIGFNFEIKPQDRMATPPVLLRYHMFH